MEAITFKKEIEIADNCRNCGMCRIDYLGSGKCHAAEEHFNFAHHPHGRLKIFKSLLSGDLPLTTETEKVLDSCTLCGKCNIQCYFQIEMTPGDVFAAKRKIFKERAVEETVIQWAEDETLRQLRTIVGDQWAFNDPTILTSYSIFGSLSDEEKMPAYVVLPLDADETAAIIKLANRLEIGFLPISSGTNSSNLIKGDIILIDMSRMKTLEINSEECWARVGAGIIAFDLQQAALKQGLRFSIGEAAAGVCANQVSTGIHSFFAYSKGLMAEHYYEAEVVTLEGEVVTIDSESAPEIATRPQDQYQPKLPFICTQLKIKLYPVSDDETVAFIPFREMSEGLKILQDISERRIGIGMGLVGIEVLAAFLSLTEEDAENVLDIMQHYLKINQVIMMMLTETELSQLQDLYPDLTFLCRDTMQQIIQGVPAITGPESMALIEDVMDEERPYDHLFGDMREYFLRQIKLSGDEVSEVFSHLDSKGLRKAIERQYFSEQYSDPKYWFNYRMFSPRFMRTHWFFSVMYFVDSDRPDLIEEICNKNKEFGKIHNIANAFCYTMPIDGGKRLFFEYEYFCNHRDPEMLKRLRKVFFLLAHSSNKMVRDEGAVYPVLNTLFNGLNKKDYYLYGNLQE